MAGAGKGGAEGEHGAAGAAAKGNDAEGAAVVAPLLDFDKRAGAAGEFGDEMTGGFSGGHDIGDG